MGEIDSESGRDATANGLALLWRPVLPDPSAIAAIGQSEDVFSVTQVEDPAGTIELVHAGLAFDLSGLDGTLGEVIAAAAFRFGFDEATQAAAGGALPTLLLDTGPHLASGRHMLPVVRAQVRVGAVLSKLAGCAALVWRPAGVAMAPDYFRRLVESWLAGGAFPALGLTAVSFTGDGSVQSRGLAFFTGREVRLAPLDWPRPDRVRLALRLIDHLVHRDLTGAREDLAGPGGSTVRVERLRDEPVYAAHLV